MVRLKRPLGSQPAHQRREDESRTFFDLRAPIQVSKPPLILDCNIKQKRRTTVNRILSVLLALALSATLVVLTPNTAYASCTDATLTGNYAVIGPGFHNTKVPGSSDVPLAVVGVFTFNGSGKIDFSFTFANNGAILQGGTGSGAYTVASDCTGSISFTSGDASGVNFNTVIIGDGAEIFGINTSPGNTQTFDAKKQ